jgi:hypothetical protein
MKLYRAVFDLACFLTAAYLLCSGLGCRVGMGLLLLALWNRPWVDSL